LSCGVDSRPTDAGQGRYSGLDDQTCTRTRESVPGKGIADNVRRRNGGAASEKTANKNKAAHLSQGIDSIVDTALHGTVAGGGREPTNKVRGARSDRLAWRRKRASQNDSPIAGKKDSPDISTNKSGGAASRRRDGCLKTSTKRGEATIHGAELLSSRTTRCSNVNREGCCIQRQC
jgi:hypothetical protein